MNGDTDLIWVVFALSVGDWAAWQLVFPNLTFDAGWSGFGRIRPIHRQDNAGLTWVGSLRRAKVRSDWATTTTILGGFRLEIAGNHHEYQSDADRHHEQAVDGDRIVTTGHGHRQPENRNAKQNDHWPLPLSHGELRDHDVVALKLWLASSQCKPASSDAALGARASRSPSMRTPDAACCLLHPIFDAVARSNSVRALPALPSDFVRTGLRGCPLVHPFSVFGEALGERVR
jgi:hypothetical protein